jgi:hypothetical protein
MIHEQRKNNSFLSSKRYIQIIETVALPCQEKRCPIRELPSKTSIVFFSCGRGTENLNPIDAKKG